MSKIAIFPGTFDPVHWGHLDVLETASRLFDKVIWAIAENPAKTTMFTAKQRLDMMEYLVAVREHKNVKVVYTPAFVVDICSTYRAEYIVRSFRMTADFEYEMQLAFANDHLAKIGQIVQTIFVPTRQCHMHISSTLVRELIKAKRESDLRSCVPSGLIDKGYLL